MDNQEQVKKLTKLVQLDIDAVEAYKQAIKNIDHADIRNTLTEFCHDHEKHISRLSTAITRLGGKAPEQKQDIKGFFIEGFTAVRSLTGTEGALKAMRTNEELTNHTYSDAMSWDVDADIKQIIADGYSDEKRHLAYVESVLRTKVWDVERVD